MNEMQRAATVPTVRAAGGGGFTAGLTLPAWPLPPPSCFSSFATSPGCADALRRGAAVPAVPGFMDGSAVHVTDLGVSSPFNCASRPAASRILECAR